VQIIKKKRDEFHWLQKEREHIFI